MMPLQKPATECKRLSYADKKVCNAYGMLGSSSKTMCGRAQYATAAEEYKASKSMLGHTIYAHHEGSGYDV